MHRQLPSHGYLGDFPSAPHGEVEELTAMSQAPLAQFTSVCVYKSNLLEARMIVTTYNDHVRLLSSEPFGG
jgi:hypothetical protein